MALAGNEPPGDCRGEAHVVDSAPSDGRAGVAGASHKVSADSLCSRAEPVVGHSAKCPENTVASQPSFASGPQSTESWPRNAARRAGADRRALEVSQAAAVPASCSPRGGAGCPGAESALGGVAPRSGTSTDLTRPMGPQIRPCRGGWVPSCRPHVRWALPPPPSPEATPRSLSSLSLEPLEVPPLLRSPG